MGEMKKILTGVITVVIHEGKILLLKREKQPFLGYWALLGGKIEFGEHPEEAAVRELKEEAGLDADVFKVKGILSEIIRGKETGEHEWHFVMFLCEMKPKHTEIISSEEGEVKWFDLEALDKEKIVPSDIHIIQKMINETEGITVHKSNMTTDGIEYYFEAFGE